MLPADIAQAFGFIRAGAASVKPASAAKTPAGPSEGAIQILALLQRDARLIDFLMEDISSYSDDQVGAAVRSLHEQGRASLGRYVRLAPVIDGVEGTYTKLDAADAHSVKLLGNVPASGKPDGGTLRHKGWRAEKIELPVGASTANVLAPAEVEIE